MATEGKPGCIGGDFTRAGVEGADGGGILAAGDAHDDALGQLLRLAAGAGLRPVGIGVALQPFSLLFGAKSRCLQPTNHKIKLKVRLRSHKISRVLCFLSYIL